MGLIVCVARGKATFPGIPLKDVVCSKCSKELTMDARNEVLGLIPICMECMHAQIQPGDTLGGAVGGKLGSIGESIERLFGEKEDA